jgi:hypothetical protein
MAESFLSAELDFISRERRYMVLEGLYSVLRRKGDALQENTERTDVEWLAQTMYLEHDDYVQMIRWDQLSADEREYWGKVAKAAIAALPGLMERMSRRCLLMSQAIKTLYEAECVAARRPEEI